MGNTGYTSQDDLEIMLTDIINRESKLSDWETNFIDSISLKIEAKAGISEKQDETFTRIWHRVTD